MKKTSVVLASPTLSAMVSMATSVQAADGPVKLTPLGSHDGEFCSLDRAIVFEDPDGTRILYDAGRTVRGPDDPRLGKIDAVLLSHVHGDHLGDLIQPSANAGLTRQAVQRVVNELAAQAYLLFAANPQHRRAKLVVLSEHGAQAFQAAAERQVPWVNQLASCVSLDSVGTALAVARELVQRLEEGGVEAGAVADAVEADDPNDQEPP
jgi:glyoxylase-like metal-dependent hydrolase (beta-lactamase superfamily II)